MYNWWQPSPLSVSKQKISTLNNNSPSPQPEALLWKELLLGAPPFPGTQGPLGCRLSHTTQNAAPSSSFRPGIHSDLKPVRKEFSKSVLLYLISQYCACTIKK